MIPNMYKIAGELTAAVVHVAARSLAAQGLSIFGDHSDVMAVRQTGLALLASASVQEAHDLAAVAQAATLATRVPFLHFFDGFRTSHELNTIELLSDEDLRALVAEDLVRAHRARAFRRSVPSCAAPPRTLTSTFRPARLSTRSTPARPRSSRTRWTDSARRTGRHYRLVDYYGHPEAERVLVMMGSGGETARETVAFLSGAGRAGGRGPDQAVPALPGRCAQRGRSRPGVRSIAVLDRTKEPGSFGRAAVSRCARGTRATPSPTVTASGCPR